MKNRSDPRGNAARRGIAQIWFALMGLMLLGFLGLSVDAGRMVHTGNQLQGAAEAAALCGAQELWRGETEARTAARDHAPKNSAAGVAITLDLNSGNSADGDIVIGYFDAETRTFTVGPRPGTQHHHTCGQSEGPERINAVKVTARRTQDRNGPVSLAFGGIFGSSSANITRSAIAVADDGAGNAGLIILDDGATSRALDLSGSIEVDVSEGTIQVNSSAGDAARIRGGAELTYDRMRIVGGYDGSFHPTPSTGEPRLADPLASLPEPGLAGRPVFGAPLGHAGSGQTQDLAPGYYPDGWDVKGRLRLAPGVYILGNGSGMALRAQSHATITGSGVVLYVRGDIKLSSANTRIDFTPPNPALHSFPEASVYMGVAIFQTRDRSQGLWSVDEPLSGFVTVPGTFYFPYGEVKVTASGSTGISRLICWRFDGAGSGRVVVEGQPSQGPGGPTYLVR